MIADIEKANPQLAKDAYDAQVVKGGKVGAAWVIDQVDLRGKKMGDVRVSLEHANFIVNTGSARADEVIMMTSYIKQQVRDELGLQLSEEIEYFGV
jgi:UDP-N-acetylmuramate dehydrogenase